MVSRPRLQFGTGRSKESWRRHRIVPSERNLPLEKVSRRPESRKSIFRNLVRNFVSRSEVSLKHAEIPACLRHFAVGIDPGRNLRQNLSPGDDLPVSIYLQ